MKWHIYPLLLVIALFVGGCTTDSIEEDGNESAETDPTVEVEDIIEISWGHTTANAEADALLLEQIARFEELNPHIKIDVVEWGWDAQEFPEQLAAGDVPDIMNIAATEGQLVIDNGYAADLTEQWEAWEYSGDFNEQILSTYSRDGHVYGVPSVVYIMGLFYDKTLFAEAGQVDSSGEAVPPATWDEFATTAKAIEDNTDAAGFCMLNQFNQGGWIFMNWGWQAGGEFERQENGEWVATFDEQAIVDAMTFMHDLRWEYDVFQDDLELDAAALLNGKLGNHECGMAIIAPDWLQSIAEEGQIEDFGLTKLPTGPGGDANLVGGDFDIVRAGLTPEEQQAAFDWIIWYSFSLEALENDLRSDVGRNRWIFLNRSLLYEPNSPISIQERELLDKYRGLPYYRDYVEAAARNARVEPPIETQQLYATLDEVLWEVLTNEDADIEALLAEAATEFEAEYLNTD